MAPNACLIQIERWTKPEAGSVEKTGAARVQA
jgi:hypothetical protein